MEGYDSLVIDRLTPEESVRRITPEFPFMANLCNMEAFLDRTCPWHWHGEAELFYVQAARMWKELLALSRGRNWVERPARRANSLRLRGQQLFQPHLPQPFWTDPPGLPEQNLKREECLWRRRAKTEATIKKSTAGWY